MTDDKMNWVQMPTSHGWWLFVKSLEEWEVCNPVSVTKIESCDNVRFESPYKEITPEDGWWYGPIRPKRPELLGAKA